MQQIATLWALFTLSACSNMADLGDLPPNGRDAGEADGRTEDGGVQDASALPDATIMGDGGGSLDANACGANLEIDSNNCGACGHSCLGGGCAGGMCAVQTVITPLPSPADFALHGGFVYWVASGTSADGYGDGVVGRIPVGGGAPDVLAQGEAKCKSIAVNDRAVFWVNESAIGNNVGHPLNRKIRYYELATGTVGTFLSPIEARDVAVGGGAILFLEQIAEGDRLLRIVGSAPEEVVRTVSSGVTSISHLTATDEAFYWSEYRTAPGDSRLVRLPHGSSVPEQLPADTGVVVDGMLYGAEGRWLWRQPLGSSQRDMLYEVPLDEVATPSVQVIAARSGDVYFSVTTLAVVTSVWKLASGATVPFQISDRSMAHPVIADDTHLYFRSAGIFRLPR